MKLSIGENLRKLRNRKNVTQDKLAEYLGVTCQAVSRWENSAAYPDIELLPELARFFEVSLEELMGCESGEKEAEEKALEIYNGRDRDIGKALAQLHEIEKQYPNNWKIKAYICESLIFPKPDSYDEVLPELRRYGYEVLEYFPTDREMILQRVLRPLVIAAPEDEVEQWADCLHDVKFLNRKNLMRIRYQEREDWERCRYYEGMRMLDALEELTSIGPIPENIEDTVENHRDVCMFYERVRDAVIGVPYRDETGAIHNSIGLFDRVSTYCGMVQRSLLEKDPDVISEGLGIMGKAVDLAILYADAVIEGHLVSDNPYLEPQKPGDHYRMDIAEQRCIGEHSLDWFIKLLTAQWLTKEITEDPRYAAQMERLYRKQEEIAGYWCAQDRDS